MKSLKFIKRHCILRYQSQSVSMSWRRLFWCTDSVDHRNLGIRNSIKIVGDSISRNVIVTNAMTFLVSEISLPGREAIPTCGRMKLYFKHSLRSNIPYQKFLASSEDCYRSTLNKKLFRNVCRNYLGLPGLPGRNSSCSANRWRKNVGVGLLSYKVVYRRYDPLHERMRLLGCSRLAGRLTVHLRSPESSLGR